MQDAGFGAERVPLSGAARGRFAGDLSIPILGVDRRAEVKCRGTGFRQLYAWLNGADLLIVRADRREPLVIVRLKFATEIAAIAERAKEQLNFQNSCSAGIASARPAIIKNIRRQCRE